MVVVVMKYLSLLGLLLPWENHLQRVVLGTLREVKGGMGEVREGIGRRMAVDVFVLLVLDLRLFPRIVTHGWGTK